jgi:hypothetical protein
LLPLAERWISEHGNEAGDPATAAAGTAMYVTELVFDIHAQSDRGSELRRRCLDVFDILIELGADDIIASLDNAED